MKYDEYKEIIRKHYNPKDEHFLSEIDFQRQLYGWMAGSDKCRKNLIEKTFFFAFDHVAFLFAKHKLNGNFEDALQEAALCLNKLKEPIPESLDDYQNLVAKHIEKSLHAIKTEQKSKNADMNFCQLINSEEVEDLSKNPEAILVK